MFSGNDADIYVAPINGISGIELRNRLNSQFGGQHSPDAAYTLTVSLAEPVTRYKALERSGNATWQEISITANYTLMRNGKRIATGRESAAESYTFVRYLVASNAAYNNAVSNIINVLSNKIGVRVLAETSADMDKTTTQ